MAKALPHPVMSGCPIPSFTEYHQKVAGQTDTSWPLAPLYLNSPPEHGVLLARPQLWKLQAQASLGLGSGEMGGKRWGYITNSDVCFAMYTPGGWPHFQLPGGAHKQNPLLRSKGRPSRLTIIVTATASPTTTMSQAWCQLLCRHLLTSFTNSCHSSNSNPIYGGRN